MEIPQPQPLPVPHPIIPFQPGVEWCPDLVPTRYSSSPETIHGPVTPQDTPPMHRATVVPHIAGTEIVHIPYDVTCLPMPIPMIMSGKKEYKGPAPPLEAMIVVDLGSVKVR
jgi:hypothetical protein